MAAAAGDYDSFDGSFTDEARFPLAAIDAVLQLEEAYFAIGINVVGDRRAAESDCLVKHLFHRKEQLSQLLRRYGGDSAARANPAWSARRPLNAS